MNVTFVCAGNICRSPMAEALFRREAAFHASLRDVTTSSSGIIAGHGNAATPESANAIRERFALDLRTHRARRFAPGSASELILALDRSVLRQVRDAAPGVRAELLGDYAGFPGEEVDDPYGGPATAYDRALTHIERLVAGAVARLGRELSGFDGVHLAHATSVPFENLAIQTGETIRLDLATLQQKIVHRRRGGYCFEQNTVFLHTLRALGFDVSACEARVRPPASTHVLPRTHMVLVVRLEDRLYLCDVGFGADGLLEPIAFDSEARQSLWTYRLDTEGPLRVLQVRRDGRWTDLYAFLPERRYPIDFEAGNWFTSTWPSSSFVLTLTAQCSRRDRRDVLRNLTLTTEDAAGLRTREIERSELISVLRETFGLNVPTDTRFRALDTEAVAAGR
jgi:N-hydroxyarylamine O-acetyltransferase